MRGYSLALVGVILFAAATARADDPRCRGDVDAWVSRASEETGVPGRAVACPALVVRVRLEARDAGPLDVEIAEPPGPAFRHAGRLRVSPILDADWSAVPAGQRQAFDAWVAWLTAHEPEIRIAREAPGLPDVLRPGDARAPWTGPWLMIAALVLIVVAAVVRRPRLERRDLAAAGGAFATALALRLGFGPFGPLHVNGQGPSWIRAAIGDAAVLSAYGPGYREIFAPIAAAFPAEPDTAIFVANATLSALTAPLGYWLARHLGLDPRRALFAAAFFALEPISIRIAATETYLAPIATLTLFSAMLLSTGIRCQTPHPAQKRILGRDEVSDTLSRLAGWGWVVAGGLVAAQAVRVHPVAWIPIALLPIVPGFVAVPARTNARLAFVAATAAIVGTVVLATSSGWIAIVLAEIRTRGPLTEGGGLGPGDQARWIGRVLLVAVVGIALSRPRAPWIAAVPFGIAMVLTRPIYGLSDLWQGAYERIFVALPIVGLAAAIPERLAASRLGASVTLLIAAVLALGLGWPTLRTQTTEALEYRWLRRELARLPEESAVAHVERSGRRITDVPDYLVPRGRAVRLREPDDLAAAATPGRRLYWLRSSICSSREARALCDANERAARAAGLHLTPLARASFPPLPSYRGLPYDRPRVEVVLYGVETGSGANVGSPGSGSDPSAP